MALVETLPSPPRPSQPSSRPPGKPTASPSPAELLANVPAPTNPLQAAVYDTRQTAHAILELVQPGSGEGPNPLEALADTLEAILLGQRQIMTALRDMDARLNALGRRG